ncbi:putative protein-lysine deacylase ABHD14B isoform X2 [Eriocheir sinensis]|uniref:putative protein-lysine deacylase ABHD14B isoform X2 n=1 Tax=Eriocheir sinensis TaxID=95602 RepID=UPI0021C5F678|nr:putative protein-lysine deacylase ABHD14B isoform X2 [Eriocheir sinensis]
MSPSLLMTKMPMTPHRVMAMVMAVAVLCLVFSAFRAPAKTLKLGAVLEQPSAAAVDALHVKRDTSGRTMADPRFWHTFNFQSESIPASVTEAAPKVTVTTNNVNIMGANTFYREAQVPAGVEASGEVVVLLHGAAFKSATWLELNTINLLAAMGHRVIAVDLPGFGNSGRQELGVELRRTWLQSFLIALNLPPCVVVSPSFSGVFSLPMLLLQPHEFDGFVPIAVDATDEIPAHRLQSIRVRMGR